MMGEPEPVPLGHSDPPAPLTIEHDAPPAKRPRMPWRLVAVLVVLLLTVLGLVGTSPFWAPPLASLLPWQSAAAGDESEQLAALGTRIDQLTRQQQERPATDDSPQRAALATLSRRIDDLEQRPATAPDATNDAAATLQPQIDRLQDTLRHQDAAVAALSQRLAAVESANRSVDRDTADRTLLLAVGELRGAIETSRPYAGELATVTALALGRGAADDDLALLKTSAAAGVPGVAVLAQRFRDETAVAILHAAATETPPDAGWRERTLARLRALVAIRRAAPTAGTPAPDDGASPAERAVDLAQAALDKGDLAGAVAALDKMSGAAATAAAPWLATAHDRLAAETALAHLTELAAAAHDDTPSPTR